MTEAITLNQNYPGVTDRVKAMVTDSIILIIFMVLATTVMSQFSNIPDAIRIITFIFIFLLYDPLFTSIFGGTIGHMIIGLRVRRENEPDKNIIFPLAILRYIIKTLLGIISLFTVFTNVKRKAIHDYVAGSVVVYAEKNKQ